MAAQSLSFEAVETSVRAGKLAPVYLLHGEEGYFIDRLTQTFENLIPEEEKDFNQTVVYAPRTDLEKLPGICRRIPMMSPYQMVIVKEAQAVSRKTDLDMLVKYLQAPADTTVLVICSRGETLKGNLASAIKKCDRAVIYESKKLRDRDLPHFIQQHINARGLNVQPKALDMLAEFVGTDLSRLYNETDKLITILGQGAMVTPEAIERHIGYSRSFNAFELVEALATRNTLRVQQIAAYFRANPKAVPTVMITAALFNFYSDLLITYFTKDKSDRGLMAALGLKWPVQLQKFLNARRTYNAFQVIEIIRAIRAFDRHTKGVGSRRNEHDLLQELLFHILTAPGNLFPKF